MEYSQYRLRLPSEQWKRDAISADLTAAEYSASEIPSGAAYLHLWPSSKQSLFVSSDILEPGVEEITLCGLYEVVFKWTEKRRKFTSMDRHADCRVCGREMSKDHDGNARCYMYDEGEETVTEWIMHAPVNGPSPTFENRYPGDRDRDDDGDSNMEAMDFTQVDHTVTSQKALGMDFTGMGMTPGLIDMLPKPFGVPWGNSIKKGLDFSNSGTPIEHIHLDAPSGSIVLGSPFGYNPPPSGPTPRYVGDPLGGRSRFVGNPVADVMQSVQVSQINYNTTEGKKVLLLLP